MKVVLQDIEHNYITRYADLYVTAWLNTPRKLKKFILENCLQDIVFHCFRTHRDSRGRGKLGKNLLSFLTAIHHNKNQTARLMIHSQCKPLLWKYLKVLIIKRSICTHYVRTCFCLNSGYNCFHRDLVLTLDVMQ